MQAQSRPIQPNRFLAWGEVWRLIDARPARPGYGFNRELAGEEITK